MTDTKDYKTAISALVTLSELKRIDNIWRNDRTYRSRSEYIRVMLGLDIVPKVPKGEN